MRLQVGYAMLIWSKTMGRSDPVRTREEADEVDDAKSQRWAPPEGEALVAQMIAGGMANITTFQGFEPRPLPIAPTLISARERARFPLYEEDAAKNAERWGRLLGSPIAEVEAPGNHQSMLEPPHVVEVARIVLAELDRSGVAGAA